ncbi:MAG TPA: class D sortase [Candidatus Acidoferrales bacterium]|nr:class D sortase [Candidatus Acidoferrales bacterium]
MSSTIHSPTRQYGTVRPLVRGLSYLLLLLGAAALGCVMWIVVSAYLFQRYESRALSRAPAQPEFTAQPRIVTEGDVIGQIEVPRLGLSAIVVQGDSDDVLRRAVGHIPETALPGQAGNIALAGHRDTIFRPLREIQVGDVILLKTPAADRTYRVDSTEVVPPTDLEVLQSGGQNELTLITCFPFHYIGHAPNRFVVRAKETGNSKN